MSRFLSAAAFALVLPVAAQASITVTPFSDGDAAFNNSVIAESAVGEFRWGNNGSSGDWEVGVGFPTSSPGNFTQAQFVWSNPIDFLLSYDGGTELELTYDGLGPITYDDPSVDLDDFGFIALRADGRFGDATVSNLVFNDGTDHALGTDLSASGQVEYLLLGGVTPGDAWSLAGTIDFTSNPSGDNRGSRPSFQIKVAAIPVPAALPLGLLALGGLGLYARRQRKAQPA